MGCCGGHAGASFGGVPPTHIEHGQSHEFEYVGDGRFTIYGPVTGIRYHFTGAGARVSIDPRDVGVLRLAVELRSMEAGRAG